MVHIYFVSNRYSGMRKRREHLLIHPTHEHVMCGGGEQSCRENSVRGLKQYLKQTSVNAGIMTDN